MVKEGFSLFFFSFSFTLALPRYVLTVQHLLILTLDTTTNSQLKCGGVEKRRFFASIKCNSKTLYMWNTLSGETVRMYFRLVHTWLHAYVSVSIVTFVYICINIWSYNIPLSMKDCMVFKFLHIRKSQRVAWIAWKMYTTLLHTQYIAQCLPFVFALMQTTFSDKKSANTFKQPHCNNWSCERQRSYHCVNISCVKMLL